MMKERNVKIGEQLSIRGDEEMYMLVPEEEV